MISKTIENTGVFKLDESWKNIEEIVPFGYGRIGRRVIGKLMESFRIPFLIDNNPLCKKENNIVDIIPFTEAKSIIGNRKIVVLTTDLAYLSIKSQLEQCGYIEYKDFCILSRFLGEWNLRYKGELFISKIDTMITSRCTLACPHCCMHISRSTHEDYSVGGYRGTSIHCSPTWTMS